MGMPLGKYRVTGIIVQVVVRVKWALGCPAPSTVLGIVINYH